MDQPSLAVEFTADQHARLATREEVLYSSFRFHKMTEDLPDIPAQISTGEAHYLYWLMMQGYMGAGEVVELGSWLGRSTSVLAAGLRDAGFDRKVISRDAYRWGGETDNRKSGLNLRHSDDFHPHFLRYTKPLRDWIESRRASFLKLEWPADRPVEILFFDGPKTTQVISSSLATFAPAFIPGCTLLVLQDYQHSLSYELPLAIHNLGDKLTLRHMIQTGGTVSFLINAPLRPEDVSFDALDYHDWPREKILEVWRTILPPLQGTVRNCLKSACVFHFFDSGLVDESIRVLRTIDFTPRLYTGWTNWSATPPIRAKYEPLFDVYLSEIYKPPKPPAS